MKRTFCNKIHYCTCAPFGGTTDIWFVKWTLLCRASRGRWMWDGGRPRRVLLPLAFIRYTKPLVILILTWMSFRLDAYTVISSRTCEIKFGNRWFYYCHKLLKKWKLKSLWVKPKSPIYVPDFFYTKRIFVTVAVSVIIK